VATGILLLGVLVGGGVVGHLTGGCTTAHSSCMCAAHMVSTGMCGCCEAVLKWSLSCLRMLVRFRCKLSSHIMMYLVLPPLLQ
jgi:hypothetical protein